MSSALLKARSLVEDVSRKGFFHLFSANLMTTLLSFGSQLLVVKCLTPSEMGTIKTLQSFMAVLSILAGFGFNTSVLKLCSEQRTPEEKALILKRSLRLTLIPVAVTLVLCLGAARLGWFSPEPRVNELMVVYLLSLPGTVGAALFMAYLQALKKIQSMALTQTLTKVVGVFVLVALTWWLKLYGYLLATIAVSLVSLAPLIWLARGDLKLENREGNKPESGLNYAMWSIAANLVATTSYYVDIFLLNYQVQDRTGIGYYSIATIFVIGLNQITATVQSIAAPYFSQKSSDQGEFMRVLLKYQKLLLAVSFAATVGAICLVPPLIEAIYGKSYAPSGYYFRILALKYFLWSGYALLGMAIWGVGEVRCNFLVGALALVLTAPVTFLFIRYQGLFGAALSQPVSALVTGLIFLYASRRVLKGHFARLEAKELP